MHRPSGKVVDRRADILRIAREQIQRKGYNGFSYADIAAAVGIRKASIHHHFPTKADLGQAVAAQYRDDFLAELDLISAEETGAMSKLQAYINQFRNTLEQDHKVCLCMMLAADQETLPTAVKNEVSQFFSANEQWLAELLDSGQGTGELQLNAPPQQVAVSMLAALEGAMIIAESMNDFTRLSTINDWLVASVKPS